MSSPVRRSNEDTPSGAISQPLVNRRLDFSLEEPRPSIERSPQKGPRLSSSSSARASNKLGPSSGQGKKRLFDLRAEIDEVDEEGQEEVQVDEDDAQGTLENDEIQQNLAVVDEITEVQEHRKPGRQQKRVSGRFVSTKNKSIEPESRQSIASIVKKGKGRPPKAVPSDFDVSQLSVSEAKPRRGRPPKNAKTEVFRDENTEEAEASQRPTKRARHTSEDSTPTVKRKGPKPPPSQRDPNARIISAKKPVGKAASAELMGPPQDPRRPKARSLYVLRSETPADDSGARVLRSGRTSVKPMAFWRNERIVYGDGNIDGSTLVLPGIKEVIRTEEVEQPRPKRATGRRPGSRRKRQLEDVEEEDEDQEPWEMEEVPIKHGEVMQWDPEIGKGNEDLMEESGQFNSPWNDSLLATSILIAVTELAYAAGAIQTREVAGSAFRYAKTLTLPFFGSGMVDLPAGGIKRVKNSRKMQMVFFVFYGRVLVKVGDTNFSIGKGGMWQVPRGESIYHMFGLRACGNSIIPPTPPPQLKAVFHTLSKTMRVLCVTATCALRTIAHPGRVTCGVNVRAALLRLQRNLRAVSHFDPQSH